MRCRKQFPPFYNFLTKHLGKATLGERPVVERITLPLKGLHPAFDGFRIVQLSDFHYQPYTQLEDISRAVTQANSLKPDLVVLTGDYVSRDAAAIFEIAPLLASLQAQHGV